MRVGNALLVAGIAMLIASLAGPSLASEEDDRTDPGVDVVAADDAVDEVATSEDAAPVPESDGAGDRAPAEEVAELDPTKDRGGDRRERGSDKEDDRDGAGEAREKQPLADVGVDMEDISFKPGTVTIKPGDEVTWTNRDTAQHDAVGTGGEKFDTGLLDRGETATVPFNSSGSFDYVCTVHAGMDGKVVVRSSSGGGGGKGGGSGTGGAGGTTGDTSTSGSSGSGGTVPSSGSSSSGSGSLPNTGQAELPLLLLGAGLIVLGLLARAFHEHWIWR